MIIWPEKELTKKVMASYAPVILAAVVYMWLTYECFQNPTSLQGFASGITNLPGLTKGFGEEVSVATAWSHFLAEDLFIVSIWSRTSPRFCTVWCGMRLPTIAHCFSLKPAPLRFSSHAVFISQVSSKLFRLLGPRYTSVPCAVSPKCAPLRFLQGRFVYLDGSKNKVFTKHSLLLCYLFGPVGLLSHLLTRGAFSVVAPVRDIMQVSTAVQHLQLFVSPSEPQRLAFG